MLYNQTWFNNGLWMVVFLMCLNDSTCHGALKVFLLSIWRQWAVCCLFSSHHLSYFVIGVIRSLLLGLQIPMFQSNSLEQKTHSLGIGKETEQTSGLVRKDPFRKAEEHGRTIYLKSNASLKPNEKNSKNAPEQLASTRQWDAICVSFWASFIHIRQLLRNSFCSCEHYKVSFRVML